MPSDKLNKLLDFCRFAASKQPEMVEIMRHHKIQIDDLDNPMQKFAFTLYTALCEINWAARESLEDEEAEPCDT